MATELGLRERKKQRTRELIAGTAWRLFSERGFEEVPVAEIAREAEVSEATVFNYFPTKEDLVFHRMEAFENELLEAIRDRAQNESVVEAFGRFVLRPRGYLGSDDPAATEGMRATARLMTSSPALRARQRDILDRYTETLAAWLADERGAASDDPESWVIANALIGVHRALIAYTHRQALAEVPNRRIARNVVTHGRRALGLLEAGLS
jgi:AcrR family transcriptional regulator